MVFCRAASQWDEEESPTFFADDEGTPVFYNFQENDHAQEATFDVLVASGVSEHVSLAGWFDSKPRRI